MTNSRTLLAICLFGALLSCTDEITLESRFEGSELAVEAWLTNESEPQTIILTESQDYYDNRLPDGVTDAQVVISEVIDSVPTGNLYVFEHQDSGRYVWTPEEGQTLGNVGTTLGLGIQRGEQQYAALTNINRTAIIDSLSFQVEEESLGLDEGIYAQIYARDQVGIGDAYFIRSTINDTLLLRAGELNLAYDATFSPGTNTDGVAFIFPIRFRINKTDDDGGPVALQPGEKVAVEIVGLSQAAYLYLRIVTEQINNGQSGLFDLPVANSPGNIFDVDTQESVLGFFNVAEVARIERIVE
ncbi:DUF4249 family protein [Neolewinella antarctica]|uniref:DUF4249 domain-containing protein n=1 Tax=Neolewinella antarctica TaxID=442734 RepID=A0ABX0X9N2_9BACT|nr:DUF4249 family protein [Neolewinella antarctica]NJC25973.1 hypothetical protein [Neolewinella antarctica]